MIDSENDGLATVTASGDTYNNHKLLQGLLDHGATDQRQAQISLEGQHCQERFGVAGNQRTVAWRHWR